MKRAALLVLATLTIFAGCADYDTANVIVLHRDAGTTGSRQVSVGGAATVKVEPEGRSNYSGTESIGVRAEDPTIASVKQTILSDTWTILGHAPGTASFRVYVDGEPLDRFTFTVTEFDGGEP